MMNEQYIVSGNDLVIFSRLDDKLVMNNNCIPNRNMFLDENHIHVPTKIFNNIIITSREETNEL